MRWQGCAIRALSFCLACAIARRVFAVDRGGRSPAPRSSEASSAESGGLFRPVLVYPHALGEARPKCARDCAPPACAGEGGPFVRGMHLRHVMFFGVALFRNATLPPTPPHRGFARGSYAPKRRPPQVIGPKRRRIFLNFLPPRSHHLRSVLDVA